MLGLDERVSRGEILPVCLVEEKNEREKLKRDK